MVVAAATAPAAAAGFGPFDAPAEPSRPPADAPPAEPPLLTGDPASVLLGAVIRFHRQVISPLDGPRCGMKPVCSLFGRRAVRRHGPLQGALMIVDRLYLRENRSVPRFYGSMLEPGGRLVYLDPVAANDLFAPLTGGAAVVPEGLEP